MIRDEINKCAIACGRVPEEIKLLAVTKTHSIDVIKKALASGIEYIAESKVQESEEKIPALEGLYKEFHFVGHLQSNKINKLLAMKPTLIHSIDKFSTAERLNKAVTTHNVDILIEINTSGEESKNGIKPSDAAELIKQIDDLEFVNVKGLMTIGALTDDEKTIRKCFVTLKELFEKEKSRNYFSTEMKYLSMGMSSDYKIAIQEGSNIVRLGSIIFGER